MKKYRIVEVREPMRATYRDEKSRLPEFIRYGTPYYYIEVKKGFFNKWKPLDKHFETAMQARFYIYNNFLIAKKRVIAEL